jgi:hypothetical protein
LPENTGFAGRKPDSQNGTICASAHCQPVTEQVKGMLVERGLQVMNVEVVGDAYAIASNYLRKAGAIPDTFATEERLLEIIVTLFQRGEFNRIRLANKAIAKFEASEFEAAKSRTSISA